ANGGVARRELPPAAELNPDIVKAIHTRRNLQALAEAPAGGVTDPARLLGQLKPMLEAMPADQAAPAAYAVASQYARPGQWVPAREAFLMMVARSPAHPLSAEAYRWLIRHAGSSEARRRHELGQFVAVSKLELEGAAPQPLEVRVRKPDGPEPAPMLAPQ